MNIRQIETFIAVAELGSFRRAAENLHRSASAVSGHVSQLEEELGVPLLERTTRQVSLTPAGRTLLARCRNALAELRSGAQDLKEEAMVRHGRVAIGCAPSISMQRLPPILASYQKEFPAVTLKLNECFAPRMYDDVRERVTDFAIGPRLQGLKDFAFQQILLDPVVAVLPDTRRWRGRKSVRLEELAEEPLVSMSRESAMRNQIEQAFHARGLRFEPRFEVVHHQTLFSLVENGLGVTLLPGVAVPVQKGRYVVAELKDAAIVRELCLITLKGRKLSPAAQRCAELVVKELMVKMPSGGQASLRQC